MFISYKIYEAKKYENALVSALSLNDIFENNVKMFERQGENWTIRGLNDRAPPTVEIIN